MAKNKLKRWAELETFNNIIQPDIHTLNGTDYPLKGNWRRDIFHNDNPTALELACGKGEYTVELSRLFPDANFIGVDIKGARIWRGAKTATELERNNTAFLRTRIELIDLFFAPDEIDEIWIVFPDPHPREKNSNKRLTSPFFLNKYRSILKDKGIVHLKTDNAQLYQYTLKLVSNNTLEIIHATDDMETMLVNKIPVPGNLYPVQSDQERINLLSSGILSIRTYYERKFMEQGEKIKYLAFRLEKDKNIFHGWEKGNR